MDFFGYLKSLNKLVSTYAYENGQTRNYIHLIRPYENLKLNIVGEFKEEINKENNCILEDINFTKNSRCSFGIVPTYQFNDVKNIDNEMFNSKVKFLEYISSNFDNFCIDDDEFEEWKKNNSLNNINKKHLQMSLFARVVLAVHSYYVRISNDTNSDYALYSGCIPRLLSIEYIQPNESNNTLSQFVLQLGHTSYITMYGLSNFDILSNELLNIEIVDKYTLKDLNDIFDLTETKAIKDYITLTNNNTSASKDEYLFNELTYINNYLKHDLNVHNINVSGNVITSDGYCIFTQRGSKVVDQHTIYPSVNGGAEIFDKQVEFYQNSVEEDFPTIRYSKEKVYFSHEHTREAIAELGLNDNSNLWNYLGVSVMAGKPSIADGRRTWLHFNILAEKYCLDTFENMNSQRLYASEKFENENIFGYKLNIFKNKIDLAKDYFLRIIKWCMSNKDIVTIFFIIIILRQSVDNGYIKKLLLGILAIFLASGKEIRSFIFGTNKIYYSIMINDNNIVKKMDCFANIITKKLGLYNRIKLYIKSIFNGRKILRKNSDPMFMLLSMLHLKKIYD